VNLVIPIASTSKFFDLEHYGYPKPLIEINGKPMIQHVVENLTLGNRFDRVIFIVKQEECTKYHLDDTLKLLSPIRPEIIRLDADTQGALCSVLLAVESIGRDEPLMISNGDQIFDGGIAPQVQSFTNGSLDAACLTFSSVHPRWSYVRVDESDNVVETAEKRPISRHAIAGLYLYRSGAEFVRFGMNSIRNGSSTEGKYFIAPVFNEYVLAGKKVGHSTVPNESYHTFYSPQKIEEYELQFGRGL
jgi:dTDP-glucose pyrophosphorylase